MAKNSGMTKVVSSMPTNFPGTTKSKVAAKYPAKKLAKREVSNEVGRPPKK